MMNVLKGGAHASNNLDIRGIHDRAGRRGPAFAKPCAGGAEVFHAPEKPSRAAAPVYGVATRRFAAEPASNEAALQLARGDSSARDIILVRRHACLDCASSEFYQDGKYVSIRKKAKTRLPEFGDLLASWVEKYSDPQHRRRNGESDWDGWRALTPRGSARRCQLVGDETSSSPTPRSCAKASARHRQRDPHQVNQIGTLTETFAAIELA